MLWSNHQWSFIADLVHLNSEQNFFCRYAYPRQISEILRSQEGQPLHVGFEGDSRISLIMVNVKGRTISKIGWLMRRLMSPTIGLTGQNGTENECGKTAHCRAAPSSKLAKTAVNQWTQRCLALGFSLRKKAQNHGIGWVAAQCWLSLVVVILSSHHRGWRVP